MEHTYLDLPSRLEEEFAQIDSDIVMELLDTDPEYAECKAHRSWMQQEHPILVEVLEKAGPVSLSEEEHQLLLDYLHLTRQMEDMERQQLYFRGHSDAVAYLKKVKAI